MIANAAVKDVYFTAITDVQIKERRRYSVASHESSVHNLHQGSSGGTTVTYAEDAKFRTYQTCIRSVANKVNPDFAQAAPSLRSGLVRITSPACSDAVDLRDVACRPARGRQKRQTQTKPAARSGREAGEKRVRSG